MKEMPSRRLGCREATSATPHVSPSMQASWREWLRGESSAASGGCSSTAAPVGFRRHRRGARSRSSRRSGADPDPPCKAGEKSRLECRSRQSSRFTLWMVIWVPVYWTQNGPSNFLSICDFANFVTLVAIWSESALLVSSRLAVVLVIRLVWAVDFLGRLLFGAHPVGGTEYMFDAASPWWLRMLSLFRLSMVPLLVWLMHRVGHDGAASASNARRARPLPARPAARHAGEESRLDVVPLRRRADPPAAPPLRLRGGPDRHDPPLPSRRSAGPTSSSSWR